ncbi:MAG: T9SS type A sorting domain-containing protein, partial [Bacteroidia bacterium]|nr:T9SS type A sorting domain-containing protein [Bacteroidia bacterium]
GQLKLSLPLKQTPGALTKLMLNESQLYGLNNGMYILRLTDGEKVYVKRVVRSK